MKRRDFIKGLVAAPVVAKVGVEAVAKPKPLYMFSESTVENHGFGLAPAPVKAEGATIDFDPKYLIVKPKDLETAKRILGV
ncbi:hypothetical protein LCGC14_1859430 [marine sediment metagenome]|uniref:Uncharacterized protein n=1 Tax=marine sediment metagenome TaxID=412755 RepID=A0A0F9GWC6_9ZZZZ